MSWIVLSLSLSLAWSDIGSKQALICQVAELEHCLAALPTPVRKQLPSHLSSYHQAIGHRGAMVISVLDPKISGVIMLSPERIPKVSLVTLAGKVESLTLTQIDKMTLWHELGHLHVKSLEEQGLVKETSAYQHEWIADSYLTWRSAREEQSLDLAWQQYHRRNMSVMKDVSSMSHWTVPVLSQLLNRYSLDALNQFDTFDEFMSDFLPHLEEKDQDTLKEFSSLIHRTFSTRASQSLPNYIYWRKPALRHYVEPTLVKLLGKKEANLWLQQQSMLVTLLPETSF